MGWSHVPSLIKRLFIPLALLLVLFIAAVTFPQDSLSWSDTVTLSDLHTDVAHEVERTVQLQMDAVNNGQWAQFKEHLWEGDPLYIQERKRWFEDTVSYIDSGSFQMEVESVAPLKPERLQVRIRQGYTRDTVSYSASFPLVYVQTADGWKDADHFFCSLNGDHVIVKYTDERLSEQANVALNVADKALDAFRDRLNWQPNKPVQIKLYDRKEVFSQSVKPSLPHWVAGWNEYGQAIKFVAHADFARSGDDTFASGIVHEITHHVIGDLSHDNAAYWLQEGLAEYYERNLLPGLRMEESEQVEKPAKPPWTFDQLERMNLEVLPAAEAHLYYKYSYDLVRFFMKQYSEEDLMEWCAALKMKPYIDQENADKIAKLNTRTRRAFEKATRRPFQDFIRDWDYDEALNDDPS